MYRRHVHGRHWPLSPRPAASLFTAPPSTHTHARTYSVPGRFPRPSRRFLWTLESPVQILRVMHQRIWHYWRCYTAATKRACCNIHGCIGVRIWKEERIDCFVHFWLSEGRPCLNLQAREVVNSAVCPPVNHKLWEVGILMGQSSPLPQTFLGMCPLQTLTKVENLWAYWLVCNWEIKTTKWGDNKGFCWSQFVSVSGQVKIIRTISFIIYFETLTSLIYFARYFWGRVNVGCVYLLLYLMVTIPQKGQFFRIPMANDNWTKQLWK